MNRNVFDDAVDTATHAVILTFANRVLALPGGEALIDLMDQINDALTPIMRDAVQRAEE